MDKESMYTVSINKYKITTTFTDGTTDEKEMWATDEGLDEYLTEVTLRDGVVTVSTTQVETGVQKGEPYNPDWVGSEVIVEEE